MTQDTTLPHYGYLIGPYVSKLRLNNFKSVAEAEVNLAPFTLLVGENSSGKSSLLQALLLLQQGTNSQIKGSCFPLVDDMITLGKLDDIRTIQPVSDNLISIGIDLSIPTQINDGLYEFRLAWNIDLDKPNFKEAGASLRRMKISLNEILSNLDMISSLELEYPDLILVKESGLRLKGLVEADDLVREGSYIRTGQWSEDSTIDLNELIGLLESDMKARLRIIEVFTFLSLNRWDDELGIGKIIRADIGDQPIPDKRPCFSFDLFPFLPARWFFDNDIRYLGPLRAPPEELWSTSVRAGSFDCIGRSGENTARVLRYRGNEPIPDSVPMPDGEEESSISLIEALRLWVIHLGLAEQVGTMDIAIPGQTNEMIMMKPHGVGSQLPLTSVGVGVSQLLPVLVLCLLAEPGSVILLEQPELHLHPALQQRLADFFIAMVRSGRQLIVETHSEYMVSRLRRRIVEDPDDELLGMSKVIFAERDRETGLSSYREVELSPYGAIEEWPAGFFDQAAEEERAIIMGGVKKLRKRAAERQ